MISHKKIMFVCAALLLQLCFSHFNIACAQDSSSEKLISALPDDVLVFATTNGADALKADFEKTIMGRVFNDTGAKAFYAEIKTTLLNKVQQETGNPGAQNMFNMVTNIVALVGSRPIIVGVAQKNTQQGPPVYGFAMLDAGARKDEITATLTGLEAMVPEGEIVDKKVGSYTLHGPRNDAGVPGYWGWVENYLVFAINDGEGAAIKYLQSAGTSNANYLEKMSKTNNALVFYLNLEKGFEMIKSVAIAQGEEEDFAKVETVIKSLGFDNIVSLNSGIGFSGQDLVSDELIEMSQGPSGIFANFKPISMNMFDMVTADAISVTALNVDLGGMYDTVFNTIKSVAGQEFQQVEGTIAMLEAQTNVKIRQGLLESLSGQFVLYTPGGTSVQAGQSSFVIIIGLKNKQLWQESIDAVGKYATEQSGGMVQVSSQEQNGRTIHTFAIVPLAMAQVIPTWTIEGDNVLIASSPVVLNTALEQLKPGANSIRNSDGFKQATTNLPNNVIGLQYTDSKVQLTQMMASLQQMWPMANMLTAQQGITLPMALPDLSNIIKDVTPTIHYSWYDDKGLRSYYKGSGIEASLGAVAGGAIGAGVAIPALTQMRR